RRAAQPGLGAERPQPARGSLGHRDAVGQYRVGRAALQRDRARGGQPRDGRRAGAQLLRRMVPARRPREPRHRRARVGRGLGAEAREAVRGAVHRSGRWLDDGRWDDYVGLFAEDGEYRLEAKAPELAGPMTWMALGRDELARLLEAAPSHEWQLGERTHLI